MNNMKKATAPKKPETPKPVIKQSADKTPLLETLTSRFVRAKQNYDRLHDSLSNRVNSCKSNMARLESQLTKAELQLQQLAEPSVKSELVDPLAKELLKLLPDNFVSYEAIGPMGIQQAVTISFYTKEAREAKTPAAADVKSVTLITKTEGGLGIRDYSKDLKIHQPGSIGFASGANHPVVNIPETATVRWLSEWIK